MPYQFVPDDFKAPFQAKNENFIIRKLTVDEVEKDYQAVMSSRASLRRIFCENDDWPDDNMTLDDNYKDLVEHQEEFDNNEGFAYTVVLPDDSICIGCLYIYPFSRGVYDCRIFYWLIDEVSGKMDKRFRLFIDEWVKENFGLKNPAYPGRDMSHGEWEMIVEKIKDQNSLEKSLKTGQ